jgi:hypothetical protein
LMAAIGEYARRAGTSPQGEFATDIAKRLPKTFAALRAGQIHMIHLRIIEEETGILSDADADAAKADADLASAAPGLTFGLCWNRSRGWQLAATLPPGNACRSAT